VLDPLCWWRDDQPREPGQVDPGQGRRSWSERLAVFRSGPQRGGVTAELSAQAPTPSRSTGARRLREAQAGVSERRGGDRWMDLRASSTDVGRPLSGFPLEYRVIDLQPGRRFVARPAPLRLGAGDDRKPGFPGRLDVFSRPGRPSPSRWTSGRRWTPDHGLVPDPRRPGACLPLDQPATRPDFWFHPRSTVISGESVEAGRRGNTPS